MNWKEAHKKIIELDKEIEFKESPDGHIQFFYKGTMISKMRKAGTPPENRYLKCQIRAAKREIEKIKEGK